MKGWQDDVPKFRQAHKDGDWYYADYLERERRKHMVRDAFLFVMALVIIVLAFSIVVR